jgi:acyl-CoA synthetase (AMP-forming)/AMP-acid ligase II
VALDAGFTADTALRFWDTVEKYNVTALWPVPSMLSIILAVDRGTAGERYAREHIKYVLTGTAPLTAALKSAFEKRYGVVLYEDYALSETFFITANAPPLPYNKGSGRVIPGVSIAIVDDDERPCPPGTPGEIVVRSGYMTSGYFNNPEETAHAFRGGAFYSGDVGYIDADQYLFVTGRKKDIIIRGGINISPQEIEEVIAAVDGVREVAVVGVPHALTGEEIVAVVAGEHIDSRGIRETCARHLAPFKVPERVLSVPELPKTATGKIQKNKIRALVMTLSA